MPPTRQRSGSANKAIIIVLAVIGAIGLLSIAACGGCVFWGYRAVTRDIPPAQAAANAFLDDLKANRVDAAYASTSSSFKSAQSLDQFREFVKKFDGFRTNTSRSFDSSMVNQTTSGKRVRLKMTLTSPNNAMTCSLTTLEENGQCKIESVTVP